MFTEGFNFNTKPILQSPDQAKMELLMLSPKSANQNLTLSFYAHLSEKRKAQVNQPAFACSSQIA